MGASNRQRRATRARQRQDRRRRRRGNGSDPWRSPAGGQSEDETRGGRSGGRSSGWPGGGAPTVEEVFAATASLQRDGLDAGHLTEALLELPARELALSAADALERLVASLWDRGWQPADLVRVTAKHLGSAEAAVMRMAVAADSARYERLGERVAPHWMAQLRAAEATRWWLPDQPYLGQLDRPWAEVVTAATRLAGLLIRLPSLEALGPPPSAWHDGMAAGAPSGHLPDGLLERVRALLAKAESTTFDAEAEAFTAKAQELMARHRIDRGMVAAGAAAAGDEPCGRRLAVDDPYAGAKAALLGAVSRANGGRVVWSKELGHATVMAYPDDLPVIEELFTSLLVQATSAMQRAGSRQDRHGRSRTRRFRQSFLTAFAQRIGERLEETVQQVVGDRPDDDQARLLPVLARRDEAVDEATARAFPASRPFRPRASDGEGWFAGTLAADQADLGAGPALRRPPV